ncbi:MAG: beta-glucosidase [Flavobacteriales bacterium]|jgi:beta-glucosidase
MQQILTRVIPTLTIGLAVLALSACDQKSAAKTEVTKAPVLSAPVTHSSVATADMWPKVTSKIQKDPAMEVKISELVKGMTLEQKVAQMIQPEIRAFTVEQMRQYGFGSYLNGGGAFPDNNKYATMADWVKLSDDMYKASIDASEDGSAIPTMWGTDAVHGHNNVIGATYFPHNIGLGATNNPELMREIGAATARVVQVTGIDWAFAPTVAVARDDRWGRTYESYSEDPAIVKAYSAAIIKGLQGEAGKDFMGDGTVIATAKHFLGDGGTDEGDDQGNTLSTEQELIDIHAQGYVAAIEEGVQTIMASFNSWHGIKMHGNESLLTDVLKGQMGFDGLVVGDWDGHGQVKGCSNSSCAQAINAGVDIIMVPNEWKPMYENTIAQVVEGEIPLARIDDAVSRILRVKFRAGLFDGKAPSDRALASDSSQIGSDQHREIARRAVRESLVLLKNKDGVLPISSYANIIVAGSGADNIGKQSGGWSISWQGTGNKNGDFPGATSIFTGIQKAMNADGGSATLSADGSYTQKPEVAVVVFGENPYAEGEGDLKGVEYQRGNKRDIKLLRKFKAEGIPVVSVFLTGRPLWVNKEINASDAFVVAWLPGTEGAGVADVLIKKSSGDINHDFKGKLSFSWPNKENQVIVNKGDVDNAPLFAYGYGLSYVDKGTLGDDLNEEVFTKPAKSINDPFVIFANRPQSGVSFFLGDGANWSVPVATSIVTTQGSDNLALKFVNWKVQEDARRLTWKGDSPAVAYLSLSEPTNLSGYQTSKSALTFSMRVDKAPTASFSVVMDCGHPCNGAVSLNEEFAKRSLGAWDTYSVDLACFVAAGTDLEAITSPFLLSTDGSAVVSFADVSIIPGAAESADISCQ